MFNMFDCIVSNITPTDVKIYMEDNVPYLDYIGECMTNNGAKLKVHIPKMGLTLNRIVQECEEEFGSFAPVYHHRILKSFNIYTTDDKWCEFEIVEREMSKEQIEKELGYKITIKE